jgi:hypothetical protein
MTLVVRVVARPAMVQSFYEVSHFKIRYRLLSVVYRYRYLDTGTGTYIFYTSLYESRCGYGKPSAKGHLLSLSRDRMHILYPSVSASVLYRTVYRS